MSAELPVEEASVRASAAKPPHSTHPWSIHPIPRASGTAVWQQLRADLSGRIENGALSPGDALPSETALAEAYQVNRLTVRRALADLARVGVIRTEHGVGSFVASRPLPHRIDDGQVSLVESMAKAGHAVRQLVLEARLVDPAIGPAPGADPAGERYSFPDFPGPVMEYRYIRWVDEVPWSVSFAAVPAALAPPEWDGIKSLFAQMSAANGVEVRRHERCFSAVPATPQDAAWLQVQAGAPLLLLTGTNCDIRGQAIAHIVHRIRGDRAEYVTRVPG